MVSETATYEQKAYTTDNHDYWRLELPLPITVWPMLLYYRFFQVSGFLLIRIKDFFDYEEQRLTHDNLYFRMPYFPGNRSLLIGIPD